MREVAKMMVKTTLVKTSRKSPRRSDLSVVQGATPLTETMKGKPEELEWLY